MNAQALAEKRRFRGGRLTHLFTTAFPEASRARVIAATLSFLFNVLVILTEWPLIASAERNSFLWLKGSAVLTIFAIGIYIRYHPRKAWPNYAMAGAFFAVSYVSFLYRPMYVVGLFEHFAVFSYAFPVTDAFFVAFAVASFLAFGLGHLFDWSRLPDANFSLDQADFLHFDLQFCIIVIFFYFFFVRARKYRHATEQKLAVIGQNASNIAHDLKGMITGPSLYLNRLMEILEDDDRASDEVRDLLNLTNRQFSELERMMVSFNQLCLADRTLVTRFSAAGTIASAREMLWKHFSSCQIFINGDFEVEGERALFLSLCFNLMTNSLQAMRDHKAKGSIQWELDANSREISCRDNGGGFSAEALAAIRDSRLFSSRVGGTGLGVPVIMQAAKQLGATVHFGNHSEGGALVRLKL